MRQFSLRLGMLWVTLFALVLGISQLALQLVVFATAFTLSANCLAPAVMGFPSSKDRPFVWGPVGLALLYFSSVGPVLLSCRLLEHGLPECSFFAWLSRGLSVVYSPVFELAEGAAERPVFWYTDSWLVDHNWNTNVSTYLLFLVVAAWSTVFAVLQFGFLKFSRTRAAWTCGVAYAVLLLLCVAASRRFW